MFIRGEGKYKSDYATKDFYKFYLSGIEKKTIYDIEKNLYTKILKYINDKIIKLIITTNFEYQMPCRLGSLSIKKAKIRLKLDDEGNLVKSKIPIDFGKTLALWRKDPEAKKNKKVIYLLNEHTDGFRCKFHWDKKTSNVPNKTGYNFRASRDNNRAINVAISTIEHLDYFEFK